MKRAETRGKAGRILTASMGLIFISMLMASNSWGERGVKAFCVLPVGDLNGDGIVDYAVSERPAPKGQAATAYVIFGDGEPRPDSIDEAFLKRRADFILRGASAAPFSCPRLDSGAAAGAQGMISPKKVPAAPPRREGESPIGRPVTYTIGADLKAMSPGNYVIAGGISPGGQVVGRFLTGQGLEHAFLFDGWELRDLGTLGGHFSDAKAINTVGEIVGYSLTGETDKLGFVNYAFISDGYGMQDLGLRWSAASDINDRGRIVGEWQVVSGRYHAFLFEEGEATDLGTLDGEQSFALAVNEAGQVVGEAGTFLSGTLPGNVFHSDHAFLYENGTMYDLGSLGYFCYVEDDEGALEESCDERSVATDISNLGEIVGFSTTFEGGTHAFLITEGEFEDLGTLGGSQSWGHAVNDSGQVVGTSLTGDVISYRPFLYDLGTMYDLQDLIVDRPGDFVMWEAVDINNFGEIVGLGYLLEPVYESISRGVDFRFSDTLGPELTFEYWVSIEDPDRCDDRGRTSRIEYMFEAHGLDPGDRNAGAGGWHPIDGSGLECSESEDWRTVSIPVPRELENTELGVRIRLLNTDGSNPVVFLRHFR